MLGEASTDLQAIGAPVRADFESFAEKTGRELKLEIEPGTFLVANAGSLVCTVQVGKACVYTIYYSASPSPPHASCKNLIKGDRFSNGRWVW